MNIKTMVISLIMGVAMSVSVGAQVLIGGGPMGVGVERFLGLVEGSGWFADVYYSGPGFMGAIYNFDEEYGYGYVVRDVDEVVVGIMNRYYDGTGFQIPGFLPRDVNYYLGLSNSDVGIGGVVSDTAVETERFWLVGTGPDPYYVIPEVSNYGILFGAGLIGFIGYRRYRK